MPSLPQRHQKKKADSVLYEVNSMRREEKFSDLWLICYANGNRYPLDIIKVHQFVFSPLSTMLKSIFDEKHCNEQNTKMITLEGIQPIIVRKFVEFIYQGKTNANQYQTGEILDLCRLLQLNTVTKGCQISNLHTTESVISTKTKLVFSNIESNNYDSSPNRQSLMLQWESFDQNYPEELKVESSEIIELESDGPFHESNPIHQASKPGEAKSFEEYNFNDTLEQLSCGSHFSIAGAGRQEPITNSNEKCQMQNRNTNEFDTEAIPKLSTNCNYPCDITQRSVKNATVVNMPCSKMIPIGSYNELSNLSEQKVMEENSINFPKNVSKTRSEHGIELIIQPKRQKDCKDCMLCTKNSADEAKNRPDTWKYTCNFCSFTSMGKGFFNLHVMKKHDMVRYKKSNKSCYSFSSNSRRAMHEMARLKKIQYACSECKFKARYSISLRTHMMKQHSVPKSYTCKFCKFAAYYKSGINHHVKNRHDHIKESQRNGINPYNTRLVIRKKIENYWESWT